MQTVLWPSCLARNLVGIQFLNSPWIVTQGLQSEVLHVFANDSQSVLAIGVRAAFAGYMLPSFTTPVRASAICSKCAGRRIAVLAWGQSLRFRVFQPFGMEPRP
jgi:hypothetical protein